MNRAVLSVIALLLSTSCSGSVLGREFASERELLEALGGFVKIGAFDLEFPTRVTSTDEASDSISFRHRSTLQVYGGLAGYDLRVVHTVREGRAGALVLRSKERRTDASAAGPPR